MLPIHIQKEKLLAIKKKDVHFTSLILLTRHTN